MIRALLVSLLLIELTACATVRETYAPDGSKSYALNCSGTARGWDKCYAAAGERCGSAGYNIIDRSSEDTASGGAVVNSQGGAAHYSKTNERTMLISCKVK
jgi:hypothetical protein